MKNDLTRSAGLDVDPSPQPAAGNKPARKVLTIERARWYRGHGAGESYLLNDAGQMCCLGFDAIACGISADLIKRKETPYGIALQQSADVLPSDYVATRFDGPVRLSHSPHVSRAMAHNDDEYLDETDRERLIRADLIALGWDDVVFV